jgi:ubiquinone/menaquinone biosynthesis C-methylase UbiE
MSPFSVRGGIVTDPHREYFNRLASKWNGMAPREPRLREYLLHFGLREGDRVLDVGSGTGLSASVIGACVGPAGCVVAQDLAESMLLEGRRSIKDTTVHFLCSDIHGLPIRSESFDKILCFSAFPHFRSPSFALVEMRRVLKEDGKLLILHNCSHEKLNRFHESLEGPVRNDRLPSPDEMTVLLEKAGFIVVRSEERDALYWVEAVRRMPESSALDS